MAAFCAIAAESGQAGSGPQLLFRAHFGRPTDHGRFSKADVHPKVFAAMMGGNRSLAERRSCARSRVRGLPDRDAAPAGLP